MKRIQLECEGVVAVAQLLEDAAQQSAQRFWDALPIEETVRHVRWSGNAAYILVSQLRDPALPLENRVSMYYPGTIAYRPEHGEFAFTYGQAQARDAPGIGWATLLANFEGESGPFFDVLMRTQHEGKKALTVRRMEG